MGSGAELEAWCRVRARPRPGSSPPPSCSGGTTIGVGERGGCPRSPEPPRPTKTLPNNLIAFMHFVVDELQQEH